MIALTLAPALGRTNIADVSRNSLALHAPTKMGDLVTLHTRAFKLRARVERVDGIQYVGRVIDCAVEEYLGEEIEFSEMHIHHRAGPVES